MRRKGFVAIGFRVLLLIAGAGLNDASAQSQYAYRVSFSDKAGSPTVSQASQFLSSRSLARRQAFGIAVDESDRPVSQAYIDTVLQLTGGVLHTRSRWLNYIIILTDDQSDIAPLNAKPWVTSTTYIAYYPGGLHNRASGGKEESATAPFSSNAKTTGTSAFYAATWDQTNLVKGDYLHDQGFKGSGKLIAVMDAGFSAVKTHNGFATLFSEGRLVDTFDFVRDTAAGVFSSANGSHGTQVLSILAGDQPNAYVGSAPEAQYALYITEDNNSEQAIEMDNMLAAAERADSIGADVINASLGYNEFNPPSASLTFSQLDGKTTIAAKAANAAARKGILFVTTAGNEGGNSWNRILTPGDADSALTIGSVDINKISQATSGFGPNAAGKVKPDVCGLGVGTAFYTTSNGIATGTGTSYAAPIIAGFAACLMEGRPDKTPLQVISAINRTGHLYNAPTPQMGHGVPNFEQAFANLSVDAPGALLAEPRFSISPNPAANLVWMSWEGKKLAGEDLSVLLLDIAGRTIWQSSVTLNSNTGRMQFNFPSQLPGGTYLLRIAGNGIARNLKLVLR